MRLVPRTSIVAVPAMDPGAFPAPRPDNGKRKDKTMARHMGMDERKRIAFLPGCGSKASQTADDIGRPDPTAVREIPSHRIDSSKRHGCSNRLCASFDECRRREFTGFGERLRKSRPRCFEACPDFFEAHCPRLARSPYVCNGCGGPAHCPLRKKPCVAEGAHAAYRETLVGSRRGVRAGDEALRRMNAVLSPCIRKGQSIRNVVADSPEVFGGVRERTTYGWPSGGLPGARRHDQPFACPRKRRARRLETKADAKCRAGRTVREMWGWPRENPGVVPCELDTVVGSAGGKALYTTAFPDTGLALAFLRDRKTAQATTRLFNMPWETAGADLFRTLFAAVLADNGPEFSGPAMAENFRPDPEHSPYRPGPRGVRAWFADPHCPTQKPHIERAHEEIRRAPRKGPSFSCLAQDGVSLVMSHVNSCTRPSLDGATPYDLFVKRLGEPGKAFLGALGTRKVPANGVTLHPFLLGQRFQRPADRAVLRKAGIPKGTAPGRQEAPPEDRRHTARSRRQTQFRPAGRTAGALSQIAGKRAAAGRRGGDGGRGSGQPAASRRHATGQSPNLIAKLAPTSANLRLVPQTTQADSTAEFWFKKKARFRCGTCRNRH